MDSFNPTTKAQAVLTSALQAATAAGNPEIRPAHLLLALLTQNDGIAAPLLAVWSDGFGLAKANPLEKWAAWATSVEGHVVPGGHFVCEEQPEKIRTALARFFAAQARG